MISKSLNLFMFLSTSLLVACGGSDSTTPTSSQSTITTETTQIASEDANSDINKTVVVETEIDLGATIASANDSATLSWSNHSNASYTVYIANDINIDENNFAVLGAEVINYAESPLTLSNTTGQTQYIKVVATLDGDTIYSSEALALKSSRVDINKTGQQLVKLDSNGNTLAETAAEWDCVLDQTSGLIWQVNNENADARYAWNDDGRHASAESQGLCGLYSAGQCGTTALIERTNNKSICGINSWRLPNIAELRGLADFNKSLPAINTDFFPNTQNGHYWAAEAFAKNNDYAWNVSFDYGHAVTSPTSANMADVGYVRLVAQR